MTHTVKEIEEIWDKLAAVFSNKSGLRPNKSWFESGITEFTGPKRLRLLEDKKSARVFFEQIKNCTEAELLYLRSRAAANAELASAAMRMNTVLNVTLIVGSIVLFNQIFPSFVQKYFLSALSEPTIEGLFFSVFLPLMVVIVSACVVVYSYAGLAQARALKYLFDMALARRGIEPALADADANANLESDLRSNLLSDI